MCMKPIKALQGTKRPAHGDVGEPSGDGRLPRFRKSLRNDNINYRNGWFFVTCQVAHNKSIFGAIVGERCELNELGRQVEAYWRGLPTKYPELELDEFVVMPNHFHAILRIHYRSTNKEQHLGFLLRRFKGGTGYIYGKMRRAGAVTDIGEHLWQSDYWDKIVTEERQLEAYRRYIRENPKNWSRDRFGAVTQYLFGNLALLNGPKIAFVASQGFFASELKPKLVWRRTKVRRSDTGGEGAGCKVRRSDTGGEVAQPKACGTDAGGEGANRVEISGLGASAPAIISTFTSAQERESLRRALAKGRAVIQVVPQGIPPEGELSPALLAACREGRALLLSPQPPGSRLNKKVATWCNEYVLRHADEIWAGDISPNGMLDSMLNALGRAHLARAGA